MVPDKVKKKLKKKGDALVDRVLKPNHIKPPPEDTSFNYIVDIYICASPKSFVLSQYLVGPGYEET